MEMKYVCEHKNKTTFAQALFYEILYTIAVTIRVFHTVFEIYVF